jgi:threonine aldolase
LLRGVFDCECEVFFVFSGTAANALSLAAGCQSYHAIVAHEKAHAATDECGGPEFYTNGAKVVTAQGERGKLQPATVAEIVGRRKDLHFQKMRALSLTQATELGTVYTPAQVRALADVAKSNGMFVHMDGARFANAVASTGRSPAELTWKSGVDVLCFGGTKNGMSACEAVLFFDKDLASEFEFRCKQAGHLASKMRFATAQWVGAIESGAWLKHAAHANECARRLAGGLGAVEGVTILMPVEGNAVFAQLAPDVAAALRAKGWWFYPFIGDTGYRLMCSWSTRFEVVDEFLADVRIAAGK